ncbi:MAG: hypothetical protein K6L80_09770 [Agarilytica sp.]
MGNETISLRRYAKTTGSLAWIRAFCAFIEAHILRRKPEIKDLAMMVPTEAEYDRLRNGDDEHGYRASKTRWRRLIKGEALAVNKLFVKRVNSFFPEAAHLRNHPLWQILGRPQATKAELKQLIRELDPKLEGKLFYSFDKEADIQHRSLFSGAERYAIAESIDAFTLKLILLRMNELTAIDHKWRLDIDALTRHLLRLLTYSHLNHVSSRLLRLYCVFIKSYGGNLDPQRRFDALRAFDDDFIFGLTTSFKYSSQKCLKTLKSYLQTNNALIDSYWLKYHQEQSRKPPQRFKIETLYFADLYSQHWANGTIQKSELYEYWSPELHHRKHQIW